MTRKRKIELDEDSSGEDASYEPKRARHADDDWKPQRKGGKAAVKGKGNKRDTEKLGELEGSIQSSPHPVSLHVIANSAPLRKALLDWYEGVHASRGMPWRKPYVHSWDAEQKAQRAYEVCSYVLADLVSLDGARSTCSSGMGFRNHATANTGGDRDPLLQQVDGEVSLRISFYATHCCYDTDPSVVGFRLFETW